MFVKAFLVYYKVNYVTFSTVTRALGKFVAWSFISVTDLKTLSCLVSFKRADFPLFYCINFTRLLLCKDDKYC